MFSTMITPERNTSVVPADHVPYKQLNNNNNFVIYYNKANYNLRIFIDLFMARQPQWARASSLVRLRDNI